MAAKSHVPWDNKLEMVFLKHYFAEDILWNIKNPYYKDRILNNAAWEKISEAMDIEVEDLKKKKDSLFSSYRLYRNKVKKSLMNPDGAVYRPVWFAYAYMDSFMAKDGPVEVRPVENEDEESEDPLLQEDDKRNVYLVPLRRERMMHSPPRKRRHTSPEPQVEYSFEESIADTSQAVRQHTQEEDDCDRYGKMLANKLRKLPENDRLVFMHEIDGMFIERIQKLNSS